MPTPTPLEIAKELKNRHPDWSVVKCRYCSDWCVESDVYVNAHPLCAEDPKNKRKRKDKTQQAEALF